VKFQEIVTDAYNFCDFPEPDDYDYLIKVMTANSHQIAEVNVGVTLHKNLNWYFLKKGDDVVGGIKLSPITISGKNYRHVDVVYILPQFRKTSAIKWLLYAVKETESDPVVADGAIFTGGQQLINSLIRHNATNVYSLSKSTGEKRKLKAGELINDSDQCYLFEANNLGFGKDCFGGPSGWIWYSTALFENF
jgi:hypothetical protein